MSKFTISSGGLLQIEAGVLTSLIQKESVVEVYHVDKTPLGRGKCATVCRAVHKKTGIPYAAKFLKRKRRNQDQMKEIVHEIAVLMECRLTNRVIRLHEIYESPIEIVLILELAAGGELQYILDGGQCLVEGDARKTMKQILEGVAYLHNKNIAHLDLKPQNILLTVEDSCDDIKLCDFGISKVLEPGITIREILGTVDYVAPEVLNYEPISLSTDIWSIGVLAYVVLSGFSPFGADDKQQTYLNISRCSLSFEDDHFHDVSSSAIDFIKSSLIIDPRKRPSVHQLLDHPWISLNMNILSSLSLQSPAQSTSQHQLVKEHEKFSSLQTPINDKKNSNCVTDSPKNQCKTFCTDTLKDNLNNSVVHTYTVPANFLCSECNTTYHPISHTSVTKATLSIDRGILC